MNKQKLSEGWKEVELGEVGQIVTGSTPPKKNPEYYGNSVPWIKPPDLDNGMYVSNSKEKISELGRSKVRLLPEGSVIVSCIGIIGKVAIAKCEMCTNQQINSIIPNKEIADSKFLYYLIKKMKPFLEKQGSSAVVPLLNKSEFSRIKIPLPPLATQKAIVSILEKAGKSKEWRKKADDLTKDYLKSVFLEMFGDPEKNNKRWALTDLKEIADFKRDSIIPEKITEDDYYIGLEHIESQSGRILKSEKAKNLGLKSNKFIFNNDCLLYGKLRPYLNKVALPNFKGVCSTDIIPIHPIKEKSNKYFLTFLLRHDYIVGKANTATNGANLPRISPKSLEKFKVYSPPISLQNKFASIVKEVEKLKEHQKKSREEIDNLFNALMQKAFKGELRC